MAVTRPRGAQVNPERRQKRLHPDHRKAQEAVLNDGKTFTKTERNVASQSDPSKPVSQAAPSAPTPVPATPANNVINPPSATGAQPADGSTNQNSKPAA